MSKYILEINGDITKDGHTIFIEDVIRDLNRSDFLEKKLRSGTQYKNLRDDLAGKAMQGIYSSFSNIEVMKSYGVSAVEDKVSMEECVANHSYGAADSMLKERDK